MSCPYLRLKAAVKAAAKRAAFRALRALILAFAIPVVFVTHVLSLPRAALDYFVGWDRFMLIDDVCLLLALFKPSSWAELGRVVWRGY